MRQVPSIVYAIVFLSLLTFYYSWQYASRLSPRHYAAPKVFQSQQRHAAAWDMFAKFKSVVYNSSEIRGENPSLPCIVAPNSAVDWNSSVCLLYALSPSKQPSHRDVSAVLHFTMDRLRHLQPTCSRWGGPVIGVLFLFRDQLPFLASSIETALKMQQSDGNCAKYLELYVAIDIRRQGGPYPVNMLRNIGMLAASTPRVVSLDADFIPSMDASAALASEGENWTEIRSAVVLPAFHYTNIGFSSNFPIPRDKEELLAMLMLGLAVPMHENHRSQHFTNYAAWPTAVEPYSVLFGLFYEPYVMLSRGRDDPLFSHLFLSPGNDKCSLHFELHAAGYQYFVHPTHFLFHVPHSGDSYNWRSPGGSYELAWVNTKLFLAELQAKYKYDMPYDLMVAVARNGSYSPLPHLVAPPLQEWVPLRNSSHTSPVCLHEFQSSFQLDIEKITVTIPSSIVEKLSKMPRLSNVSCEGSKSCIIMAPVGYSCTLACHAMHRNCDLAGISLLNNCELMPHVPTVRCPKGCFKDQGFDLPAVPMSGPQESQCLTNNWSPSCNGRHDLTSRLCACV